MSQTFKNPKAGLLAMLKESGPVPGDTNGVKGADSAKKKRRPDKGVCFLTLFLFSISLSFSARLCWQDVVELTRI